MCSSCPFDPLSEYLKPRFQGLRLTRGEYQPIRPAVDGSLVSRMTGVTFRPQGESLHMTDRKTGQDLLGYADWKKRAQAAEERAEAAEARARALEEELERLRRS